MAEVNTDMAMKGVLIIGVVTLIGGGLIAAGAGMMFGLGWALIGLGTAIVISLLFTLRLASLI